MATNIGTIPTRSIVNPFGNLPDLMKSILTHDVNTDINIEIKNAAGLTNDQRDVMMGIIRKIILKTINPSQLLAAIQNDIKLAPPKAKKLALDLLGRRFLPMQFYVGNVEGLIKELGGDLEKYQAEARKNYPEVYDPNFGKTTAEEPASEDLESGIKIEPSILHSIDERLQTNGGRAEVLLRLTGVSEEIEGAMKSGKITQDEGQKILHSLDALSYAVNTQDLNPLEVAAIKRKLKSVLAKLESAAA